MAGTPDPSGHGGAQAIKSSKVETTPTDADLLTLFNASETNEMRALSLANLFLNAPPIAADSVKLTPTEYTASGAIDVSTPVSYVELNKSDGSLAMTIAAPVKGQLLIITQTDSGTQGHTVTLTAGDFDGTNNVATFNAQEETLILFGVSATRYVIVENIDVVALS